MSSFNSDRRSLTVLSGGRVQLGTDGIVINNSSIRNNPELTIIQNGSDLVLGALNGLVVDITGSALGGAGNSLVIATANGFGGSVVVTPAVNNAAVALVNVGGAKTGSSSTGLANGTTGINLRTAVSYAVAGYSTVTNTGSSVVTGNLALYPGTSVTGFPPGTVSGVKDINDANALQVLTDAGTAYTFGQTLGGATVLSASSYDLGSTSPAPGLYSIGTSAAITGTVTLDAGGNPNAIWIFQIGSTLTTAASSIVALANGAQAQNVYFLVGTSATLGTSSIMRGTILAHTSITATTSASVTGHLLALNGAITLDTNVVTATPAGYMGAGTNYNASITVDGGTVQNLVVNGAVAQTYTALIAALNGQTSGGVWSLSGGNLIFTDGNASPASGTILLVDGPATNLFSSLTNFASITNTNGSVTAAIDTITLRASDTGNVTLVGGTVTVADTGVTASSILLISRKTIGGTVGNMSYTLSTGVGFTINSSSGTDTSTVSYMRVN